MKVCLLDDAGGGHRTSFTSGIVRAALSNGHEVALASSAVPAGSRDSSQFEWIETPQFKRRDVLRGRRIVRDVAEKAHALNADAFWNLSLDKTIWSLADSLDGFEATVHVLHQVSQYTYAARDIPGWFRARYLRRRLKRLLIRSGLVVHTQRAASALQGLFENNHMTVQGYPVRPAPSRGGGVSGTRPALLFVGKARPDKGLSVLLEAISGNDKLVLEVVGPQESRARGELEQRFPIADVEWTDRFVTDAELSAAYHNAVGVVVPYLTEFGEAGHASGVLLEALSHGVPLITADTISSELPDDYAGAIVVRSGDPEAFARAINSLIQNLDSLRRGAEQGPTYVQRYHSYEAYVQTLVDLSQRLAAA